MSIKISEVFQELKGIKSTDGFYAKFKSAGVENMKVDGSSTPVVFTLEDLPEEQIILVQSISFLIGADEIIDLEKFADITAPLVNGILFEAGAANSTIRNNADVFLISSEQVTNTAGEGVNTFTLINGRWDFTDTFGDNGPMLMNKDQLKITIRDNLTSASFFKVACHGILIEEN